MSQVCYRERRLRQSFVLQISAADAETMGKATRTSTIVVRIKRFRLKSSIALRENGTRTSFKSRSHERYQAYYQPADFFVYWSVARTARPGATPSTTRPSLTTKTPLTNTYGIPVEGASGCSYVALSVTVAGSKIVMSASAPARRRPLFLIAGALASNCCAGNTVIFRMASIRERTCCSRTYTPKIRAKLPASLG